MNIPICYEDKWLLVLNKPAGLLTLPTPKKENRTLTSILNEDLKSRGLTYRLHPCHRLDRETSGLIIYAKGKSAQQKIMQLFKQKNIKKTYLAFIQGNPSVRGGQIDFPIDGLSAKTAYRMREARKNFSLIEVTPLSGRTNQIRIHFKNIGHPLVGESKFAFRKDYLLKAKRVCLHAQGLEFRHPFSGEVLKLEIPLPADMEDFLTRHPD